MADVIKRIRSRIQMINNDIRMNMTSLSLSGNFDEDVVRIYFEEQNKMFQYIQDVKHLQLVLQDLEKQTSAELSANAEKLLLKVKSKDVCSELSIEETGIVFRTKKFLVDTENFKIKENGDVYLNGEIHAVSGEIAGWKIEDGNLVGQNSGKKNVSTLEGGKITAGSATAPLLTIGALDFNPQYEDDYHNVDLSNAQIDTSQDVSDNTQFGDLTIWGSVTLEGESSLECGTLNCTSLIGRGSSGYITIYCDEIVTSEESFSDARLKEEIETLPENAERLLWDLNPVTFCYKDGRRPAAGFIAQEVKVACEKYGAGRIVSEGKDGFLSLGYRQLLPFLILAVQKNAKLIEDWRREHGRKEADA